MRKVMRGSTHSLKRGRDGLLALKNDKVKMFIAEEF
jgi:hypothetical protein